MGSRFGVRLEALFNLSTHHHDRGHRHHHSVDTAHALAVHGCVAAAGVGHARASHAWHRLSSGGEHAHLAIDEAAAASAGHAEAALAHAAHHPVLQGERKRRGGKKSREGLVRESGQRFETLKGEGAAAP